MFLRYFDKGIYTLPIRKSSKAAALAEGYSNKEWSENGIPQALIEEWDSKFPITEGWGIALLCGKSSGIIALDIDSADQELFRLMPFSPCVKKGNTGETRFFRYNGEETKKIKPQIKVIGKEEVEILSNGKYTLLPPSIHPDTKKQYVWMSVDDLYRLDIDELPFLDDNIIQTVEAYYAKKFGYAFDIAKPVVDLSEIHSAVGGRCANGAHDRLKKKAALLIDSDIPFNEGALELLQYDIAHHEGISYFNDKSRGADSKADPETNAIRFYAKMLENINIKRLREGKSPHKALYEIKEFAPPILKQPLVTVPYPKGTGIIGLFQEHCELLSNSKLDALSLGGALALMSVICANRFRTQAAQFDVRSNIYILNLAVSGLGKEAPQRLVEDLLADTDLLGSANYKSGTSIIQDLPLQQERLNVMDECAAFLKSVASGEGFQQEINDILSQLFTKSASKFAGFASVGQGSRFGACWNPSVSIFGSTTVHGFKGSVNRSMGEKGLMARFLTFWQSDVGKYKEPSEEDITKAAAIKVELKNMVKSVLSFNKNVHPDHVKIIIPEGDKTVDDGVRYDPELLPMNDMATKIFKAYRKKYFPTDGQKEHSFEDPFKNRFAELAARISIMYSISSGKTAVDRESIEWSIAVVEASWANVKGLYEETSAENQLEAESIRTMGVIKSKGPMPIRILKRDFMKGISPKRKQEIIDELVSLELAKTEAAKDPHKSGPSVLTIKAI